MNPHSVLVEQLESLSAALDDGADLGAILSVLVDDLVAVVPSFVGLEMTVIADGAPLTLSTLTDADGGRVRASLRLPLDLMGVAIGATAVVYAAEPGVFGELAETTREYYGLDGQVVVDGDLSTSGGPQVSGLTELSTVNQVLGMRIEDGHTLDEARDVLQRRAEDTGRSLADVARDEMGDRT